MIKRVESSGYSKRNRNSLPLSKISLVVGRIVCSQVPSIAFNLPPIASTCPKLPSSFPFYDSRYNVSRPYTSLPFLVERYCDSCVSCESTTEYGGRSCQCSCSGQDCLTFSVERARQLQL